MRRISTLLSALLLIAATAVHGQQKVNPATQIKWPGGCQLYDVATNTCVSAAGAGLATTGGTMTGAIAFGTPGASVALATVTNLGLSPWIVGIANPTSSAPTCSASVNQGYYYINVDTSIVSQCQTFPGPTYGWTPLTGGLGVAGGGTGSNTAAGALANLGGAGWLTGSGAPVATCSSVANKGYFYTSNTLSLYQCSNVTGSYLWNLVGGIGAGGTVTLGSCGTGTPSKTGSSSGFIITGIASGTASCAVTFSPLLTVGGCVVGSNAAGVGGAYSGTVTTSGATFGANSGSPTFTEIYAQCF